MITHYLLILVLNLKGLFNFKQDKPVNSLYPQKKKSRYVKTFKDLLPVIIFCIIITLIIIVLAFMGATEANTYYYHMRG